ncbi:MAG: hypothetical protein U0228_33590 [Myxococcaceae bacterium]
MNALLSVWLLLATQRPSAEVATPRHVLQCEEARRFAEAVQAAGLVTDAGAGFSLPELSCGEARDRPGSRNFYRCTSPSVSRAAAQRIFEALAATGIEASAAMMQAVYSFSDVQCRPTKLGLECTLTNEMRTGTGDLRGEKLVKRRASCTR